MKSGVNINMSDPIEPKLTRQESLNLKKLLKENDCEDNTAHIRKVRNSGPILADIETIEKLKKSEADLRKWDAAKFKELAAEKANFLFFNYTDIFNKLLCDEINLEILYKFIWVLKMIEDERVDQHEASVGIGKLLKELYVDSALRRSENLDKANAADDATSSVPSVEPKAISWTQWKDARARIIHNLDLAKKAD